MLSAKPLPSPSKGRDWNSHFTAALWALEDGIESDALVEKLTTLYGRENARGIVDTASVRLWLAEGVSPSDAITMLECRRRVELSACDRRAYAIEILLNVRQAIRAEDGPLIPSRKDLHHAAA
jgi:hypothetical protein